MNKLNALNSEGQPIILGRTEVIVKKKVLSDSGREQIETVQKGVVIAQTTTDWLRVHNYTPNKMGGDASIDSSEWFPRLSKYTWCEIIAERPPHLAFNIPRHLRS